MKYLVKVLGSLILGILVLVVGILYGLEFLSKGNILYLYNCVVAIPAGILLIILAFRS